MAVIRAGVLCLCVLWFSLLAGLLERFRRRYEAPVPQWPSRMFCRLLLAVLRVRVIVDDRARGNGGRLIVANHVSWIDILVFGSVEAPCFLAKEEVASWPLVAALARLQDTVFVNRNRRKTLPKVNRELAERMRRGRSVLLFPEGTTHDGHRRGAFRTSHLACLRDRFNTEPALRAATVQAVALAYSDPAAAWIGDATLLPHLWGILSRPSVVCRLAFGPRRDVGRGYDRKALGRTLAADVEAMLLEHAFDVTLPSRTLGSGSDMQPALPTARAPA